MTLIELAPPHEASADRREDSSAQSVETAANYRGNWTQLQTERMASEDFLRKFEEFTRRGAAELPVESDAAAKGPSRAEYEARITGYPALHELVTSRMGYVASAARKEQPVTKGQAEYTAAGPTNPDNPTIVVFRDGITGDGNPLTGRQKDMVAAHEVYHGLVSPEGANTAEVRAGFDTQPIRDELDALTFAASDVPRPSQKYMMNPRELTARMAQLKNYFGMRGAEPFTAAHLKYATDHYVPDTGVDNNMSLFFKMIKPEPFLRLMNELPV